MINLQWLYVLAGSMFAAFPGVTVPVLRKMSLVMV